MKKSIALVCVIFCFIIFYVQESIAQQQNLNLQNKAYVPNADFYTIKKEFSDAETGLTDLSESGEVQTFKRFENYWRNKVNVSDPNYFGKFTGYGMALNNWTQNQYCTSQTQGGSKWSLVPGQDVSNQTSSGIMTALYVDPVNHSRILTGTNASGIWRTTDGGASWQCVTDNLRQPGLGIQQIIADPTNANILYAPTGISTFGLGYGIGILKSVDGGNTWATMSFPPASAGFVIVSKMAIDPVNPQILYALSGNKVYKFNPHPSINDWVDVTPVGANPNSIYSDIEILPGAHETIFVSSRWGSGGLRTGEIFMTEDGGATWSDLSYIAKSNSDELITNGDFSSWGTGFNNSTYFTDWLDVPNLQIWSHISVNGNDKAQICLQSIGSQTYKFYQGFSNTFQGNYFMSGFKYEFSFSVDIPSNARLVIRATDAAVTGGIQPSPEIIYDSGFSGQPRSLTNHQITFIPSVYNEDLQFEFSTQPGYNPNDCFNIDDISLKMVLVKDIAICTPNTNDVYFLTAPVLGGNQLYKYDVLAATVSPIVIPVTPNFLAGVDEWSMEFEVSPSNLNMIYIGGVKGNRIDLQAGTNHFICGSPLSATPTFTQHDDIRASILFSSPVSGGVNDELYFATDGGLFRSYNGGATWQSLNGKGLVTTQFYDIDVDETASLNIVGGTQDNGTFSYYRNSNDQYIWGNHTQGDGNSCFIDFNSPNRVLACENANFFPSSNYGSSWGGFVSTATKWYIPLPSVQSNLTPDEVYYGTSDLFKHTNFGDDLGNPNPLTWTTLNSPIGVANASTNPADRVGDVGSIGIAPSNGQRIFIATNQPAYGGTLINRVARTTDGGGAWTDITSNISNLNAGILTWSSVSDFVFDATNENSMWASLNRINLNGISDYGVIYSADGGDNWTDFSDGLPSLSINTIAFDHVTNVLYAGTDVAVYYREVGVANSTWQCYSAGLPVTIISDLEINQCRRKLVAGTFGRGIWESDLVKLPPMILNSCGGTCVWNTPMNIKQDVIIPAGVKLKVNAGAVVNMAAGTKIVVERGARLEIDAGIITSACNAQWQGIEVYGTTTSGQFNVNGRGFVSILNNGKIERAQAGIFVGKYTNGFGSSGDPNYYGGVVQINQADFTDCTIGIQLVNFHNKKITGAFTTNFSRFENVHFKTTDFLYDLGLTPSAHLAIASVDGISIKGCSFDNQSTSLNNVRADKRGYGLLAINASYTVTTGCGNPNVTPCIQTSYPTFNNLYYGVLSGDVISVNKITISQATFNNCHRSISVSAHNYATVTKNTIALGDGFTDDNNVQQNAVGIYLYNSNAYKVQENSLDNTAHVGSTYPSWGIIAHNSGNASNFINNNTLSKLSVGTQAQNNNNGLQFKCNTYTAPISAADIAVTSGAIAQQQGSCLTTATPAGNVFSHTCGVAFDIATGLTVLPFNYNRHIDRPFNCSVGNVTDNNCLSLSDPNSCALPVVIIPCLWCNILTGLNFNTQANGKMALIDGGNTGGLLSNISSNMSNGNLKNLLISKSPYLSDAVLLAYLNKNGVPAGHIKDIVIANSPLSATVMQKINSLSLPNGIRNQINAAQTGISPRTQLESEIFYLQSQKDLYRDEAIRGYLSDTTIENPYDSVLKALTLLPDVNSEKIKAAIYIQQGKFTDAQNIINTLCTSTNNASWCKMANVLLQAYQALLICEKVKNDPNLEADTRAVKADLNSKECANADFLLNLAFQEKTDVEPVEYLTFGNNRLVHNDTGDKNKEENTNVTIYPNPNNGQITIEFKERLESTVNYQFVLYDVMGNLLFSSKLNNSQQQNIELPDNLASGVYFYHILFNSALGSKGKIIVTK